MASKDVSDVSFNNLAKNAKLYRSKIQDKSGYSQSFKSRSDKDLSSLIISSNKAVLLATKLANKNNKRFAAQYKNIPDRLKQLKKEKARVKKENSSNIKSPIMAILSIDRNVKKIFTVLDNKFGEGAKRIKASISTQESYDAKKLGIADEGKKWKANIFSFISDAMRQSTLSSLKVDQNSYYHSRFGEGEKEKGFFKSMVRAYKVASDETTMSVQEKMLKALLDMKKALSTEESITRQVYERLLMEHRMFREMAWVTQKISGIVSSPFRAYRWATKSRGGYKSNLPRGLGAAEHTASVLDMIYVDSMWRLDNIVHHLKQQYNLWNDHIQRQDGIRSDDPTDVSKGTYSFMPTFSKMIKKLTGKWKASQEMPEYEKYQVTQKDLLEKQVQIGYTQIKLLKIINSSILHCCPDSSSLTFSQQQAKLKRREELEAMGSASVVGRTETDDRLDDDDYFTNKKHPRRMMFWKAKSKYDDVSGSKTEKLKAKIEKDKKKIADAKARKLYKSTWKSRRVDRGKELSQLTDEHFNLRKESLGLTLQTHLPTVIAAGKKISQSSAYGKIKNAGSSAIQGIKNKAKNINEAGTKGINDSIEKIGSKIHGKIIPDRTKILEARQKKLTGQDNITDRLVLKFDQLIRSNSIANKLRHNSYRLAFKSFIADEKARFKAKHKDSWWYKTISWGFGLFKSGFTKLVSVLTLGMGVKGFLKFGTKKLASSLMTGRGLAGAAGIGMAGYDAYQGVKKAKEWKTSKTAAGIGAALGGAGEGGVGSALKGAAKGALIGSMIFPGLGTAIGGLVGGIAGYFGGKNIAKSLDFVMGSLKKAWKVMKTAIMYPFKMWMYVAKKFTGFFGNIKDMASNAISGIYKWVYDKLPSFVKPFVPKPSDPKNKSIEETALKTAKEMKAKKEATSSGSTLLDVGDIGASSGSLVSKNIKNTVELAKQNSQTSTTIADNLIPLPTKKKSINQNNEKSFYKFDNKSTSSYTPPKKEHVVNIENQKDRTIREKIVSTAAAIPANKKEIVESGKGTLAGISNWWSGVKKSKLGQQTASVYNDASSTISKYSSEKLKDIKDSDQYKNINKKFGESKKIFKEEYPDFWNDVSVTKENLLKKGETLGIRAQGRIANWKMKFRNSDFAKQLEIYAIQGEWNWKKFKKSELYKQAADFGIDSEEKYNKAISVIKDSSVIKKAQQYSNANIDQRKNMLNAGIDKSKKQSNKVIENITDNPNVIRLQGLVKSPKNALLIAADVGNKISSAVSPITNSAEKLFKQGKQKVQQFNSENKTIDDKYKAIVSKVTDVVTGAPLTFDIWSTKAEGKYRNLKSEFDNSDFAHNLGIMGIKGEYKWKQFQQSELYKEGSQFGITTDRAFNKALSDAKKIISKNTPAESSAEKLKSTAISIIKRKNKPIVDKPKPISIEKKLVTKKLKSTTPIADKPKPISIEKKLVTKKLKSTTTPIIKRKNKPIADKPKPISIEKKLVTKKLKSTATSIAKQKSKPIADKPKPISIEKKLVTKKLNTDIENKKLDPKTGLPISFLKEKKKINKNKETTRLQNKYLKQYKKYVKDYRDLKFNKKQTDAIKEDTEFALIGILTSAKNFTNLGESSKKSKDITDITTIGLSSKKYATDKKSKNIIHFILDKDPNKRYMTKKEISGFNQAVKDAKGSGLKADKLRIKTLDKAIKGSHDQATIDKLTKARDAVASRIKATELKTPVAPPIMNSKNMAESQVGQERSKLDISNSNMNKALSKQTDNLAKENKQTLTAIQQQHSTTVVNNSSNSSNSSVTNGGSGGGKASAEDPAMNEVMHSQFDF